MIANPYPKLLNVTPCSNYSLKLEYKNGENLIFNVLPFLDKGIFKPLRNIELFNTVKVASNTVEWANGADIDPESLYNLAESIE